MAGKNYTTDIPAILLKRESEKADIGYEVFISAWNEVGEGNVTVFSFNTSTGL